jgi:polar amino acid transport system substrate-binding protein
LQQAKKTLFLGGIRMRSRVIIILLLCSINLFSETITIATDKYEPYVVVDSNGNHSGVIVEIIKKSFEKEEVEVIFENYPFARAISKIDNNEIEAAMPKMKTEERIKKYLFTDPIIDSTSKFFYIKGRNVKDNFNWKKMEEFKKYKLGGTLGYWYLEEFKKIGLNADVSNTDEDNIRKLYFGRIDFFIIDEVAGWEIIKKLYPESIKKFSVIDREESISGLYLMLNKKNPKSEKVIKIFNEGLKKLKESGEYEVIIKRVR